MQGLDADYDSIPQTFYDLGTMKTLKQTNQVIWYNDTLLKEPPSECFDPAFWQQNGKVIGSAQGRGTTWFVQTETLPAALRHYRRGGLFGKLVSDQYGFQSWQKTRSYQEYQLLEWLASQGVNVPRPIAARAVRSGLIYRADILSEKVANARDLVDILQQAPLSVERYQAIGQQIRKMHDAQVNHTDLNIHNILLDDQQRVWIIDFDKCYQQEGENWKASNWSRLKRSFIKEKAKRGIHWNESDWKALFSASM